MLDSNASDDVEMPMELDCVKQRTCFAISESDSSFLLKCIPCSDEMFSSKPPCSNKTKNCFNINDKNYKCSYKEIPQMLFLNLKRNLKNSINKITAYH